MNRDIAVRRGHEADSLHRDWLGPDGTSLWVDLVYRLLLGRPAEEDALLGSWRTLVMQPGSRRALVREIVASREFGEAALIEQLVALVAAGDDWKARLAGEVDTTERVVEIPWVLSHLRNEPRILDVGTRHAFDAYLTALLRLEATTVVGVDLAMERMRGLAGVAGNCSSWLPFASGSFSFVSCISTLEHVGHDNTRYARESGSSGSPADALVEMARVLDAHGRIAITVPYGQREDHGWFEQYDEQSWRALVASVPLEIVEEEVFVLEHDGWRSTQDRGRLSDIGYCRTGPAAGAVLCALLRRT